MTTDIKERKVCPHCYKQYGPEDNYCGNDGAHLVTIDFNAGSTKPAPAAATDSGGAGKS